MKSLIAVLAIITIAAAPCWAQAPSPPSNAPSENADLTYHFTVMLPQYRFLNTSGNPSRAGEYDSLQQSVGGELTLNLVEIPEHLSLKSTADFVSRDDYDIKSRLTLGKWLDFALDNRSFVRHLDNNFSDGIGHNGFYADLISPDIIRTDTVPVNSLLGVRRRINSAQAKVQLPNIPVKFFVKGGWQARDGTSKMQYYDMGGSGDPNVDGAPPPDQQCANCHSASQYRSLNYTTRNIAGGAEVTLGKLANFVYQHEFRSFNDRMSNPVDYFGTSGFTEENIPDSPLGNYVHSVLPRSQTQADSLQITMAVAHHVTLNTDVSYARTQDLAASYTVPATLTNGINANHQQNAFNADVTLTWHPVSPLRVIADYHQQNLLNDFVQTYTLSPADPNIYTFGNPSLHRHWAGVKLAYRLTKQFDVETYYKRVNITRSNSFLWPQVASPDNYDPLLVVPASFSNIAGVAFRFHNDRFWNARTGYEWTGTHDPGYVTDPHTNHHVFGDLTFTPVPWFTIGNDASIVLQQSFPAVQRSNHLYTDTTFLTVRPVPEWTVGGSFSYLQDNLRTDMRLLNDAGIAQYTQPLVPYKELDQNYSVRTSYEIKKQFGIGVDFARSLAHSEWRPDVNPANYPTTWTPPLWAGPGPSPAPFNSDGSYATYADYVNAFGSSLALGSGVASHANVPQTIIASTADYRFGRGFNGGFRFNYGSYANRVSTTYTSPLFNYQPMAFNRSDLNGIVRSYTVFVGRVW
jgi:hypothetical protein